MLGKQNPKSVTLLASADLNLDITIRRYQFDTDDYFRRGDKAVRYKLGDLNWLAATYQLQSADFSGSGTGYFETYDFRNFVQMTENLLSGKSNEARLETQEPFFALTVTGGSVNEGFEATLRLYGSDGEASYLTMQFDLDESQLRRIRDGASEILVAFPVR